MIDVTDLMARFQRIADDLPWWLREGTRRLPSASSDLGLIGEPAVIARMSADHIRRSTAIRLRSLILVLAGDHLRLDDAEILATDPDVVARVSWVRHSVYEQLQGWGRIELVCPSCQARQSMSLGKLVTVVGVAAPPIARPDGEPRLPSLATFVSRGARPLGLPAVAGLEVVFPAGLAGIETLARKAVLGPPLTPASDAIAQRRWMRDESVADPALIHRRNASPAFRTIVRVWSLCASVDGHTDVDLDVIEALPVVDVLFVDAVHRILYSTDVLDADRAVLPCPGCGVSYSVVR